MRLSAKNGWTALGAILGIGASFIPDPVWLRVLVVAAALVAVWIAARSAERSDRKADRRRELDHSESLNEHATSHDYLRTVTERLFRKEEEILRSGSLVDRLRLAAAQLALFCREEQLLNPMPPVVFDGLEGRITKQSRISLDAWTTQAEATARVFHNAFAPRIRHLLREAAGRPQVGQLIKDAEGSIDSTADTLAMYRLAARVNEIALVIETGEPLR